MIRIINDLPLVKKIANKMRNIDFVNESVFASYNRHLQQSFPTWSVLSLSEGYSGILLLFSELEHLFPNEQWEDASYSYVLRIKKIIELDGISDLSLFTGLAGICFSLQEASKSENRYLKLLKTLNSHLIATVEDSHLRAVRNFIQSSEPCPPYLYDVISGICGIGVYALKNLESHEFYALAQEIVRLLVLLTQRIKVAKVNVPGWYVPNHYLATAQEKLYYPKGNFNLGMAHGIPGVLAFLSVAFMHGITIDGHNEAVRRIVSWLQEKRVESSFCFWANRVSFEEEVGEEKSKPYFKDAWCYGTPGVARSLFLASLALQDAALKDFAVESFRSIFLRNLRDSDLSSPTFCHGIAGLLTMTHHMALDAQCSYLEEKVLYLKNLLLDSYDTTTAFGFQDVQSTTEGSLKHDEAGILTGVSGVLLTLLSFHIESPTWDFPFLISTNIPIQRKIKPTQLDKFASRV